MDERIQIGKFARDNQLISAAASKSKISKLLVKKVMDCENVKLIDKTKLIKHTYRDGCFDFRVAELTPLMIGCIMGHLSTV